MHFTRCARVLLLSPFIAFLPAPVAAQDVLVTLTWAEPKDAPDELPAFKKKPQIKFPEELRSTPDIGYVVRELSLDDKGREQGGFAAATQPALARAVQEDPMSWSFSPGRRAGKGVNTLTTVAFIFNPASAGEKMRDATPRLLEVSLVELPAPKDSKPDENFTSGIIFADVSVDATGAITAVKNGPPALAGALAIAVKNWRFAPAREAGKPVAAEVRVPFILVPHKPSDADRAALVLPRPILQVAPQYPLAMRYTGMKGEVIVDFVVDIEGRVRDAFVSRSLNPSFDDPALEAVRKWRFEPGRDAKGAVNSHLQVPIVFYLKDTSEGGEGPLQLRNKADLSKLPAEFRYDTPPRPIGTTRAVYPHALLRDGKTGRATVTCAVGRTGQVEQVVIREATAPEFGAALAAAIEQFEFEPALKGGRPCPALLNFSQEFDRSDEWQIVDREDLALLWREQKKPASIVTLRELDAKLTPVSRRPPVFPSSLPPSVTKGEALIEFLVDEDGRARLPRVVSATEKAFGYAAAQSIASWRFEPPKRGGKSAVVRAQIPVEFKLEPRDPAAK